MALGVTFIIVAVVVVAIWLIIEAKRLKHKVFAIFIIALILFSYISFSVVIKNNDIDLKTTEGWKIASKLYFNWLGHVFSNIKDVTTYAIKKDWKEVNSSIIEEEEKTTIWDKLE